MPPVRTHTPVSRACVSTWLGRACVNTLDGAVVEILFGETEYPHEGDDTLARAVAQQIREFLHQDRRVFHVPLNWSVMPPVYARLLRTLYENVPWGQVVTYGELAAMADCPGAARAAGTACRFNPFPIVVPAHRVIAAGGRLGGYAGRPDLKRRLLEREGSGPFAP